MGPAAITVCGAMEKGGVDKVSGGRGAQVGAVGKASQEIRGAVGVGVGTDLVGGVEV
jgi:hypothetical protein